MEDSTVLAELPCAFTKIGVLSASTATITEEREIMGEDFMTDPALMCRALVTKGMKTA